MPSPYGQVTLGSTEHRDFYGYNAESYNPNTGIEFLRARYYNANQGRFFQEDTYLGNITDPLTLNRYAYVKNSPLNYIDPSGQDAFTIEHDGYYDIGPDNKQNNMSLDFLGMLLPFGDVIAQYGDKIINHIEYIDNETIADTINSAISAGITAGELRIDILIKFGFLDEAAKASTKLKFLHYLGLLLGGINLYKSGSSDDSYASQVTTLLYHDYLINDRSRDNLIARYGLLYVLVKEAIDRGAITYCKGHFYTANEYLVVPDSVKIVDDSLFESIMDEFGYTPESILEAFPIIG